MSVKILYISDEKWDIFDNANDRNTNITYCSYKAVEELELLIPKKIVRKIQIDKDTDEKKTILKIIRKRLSFHAIIVEDLNKLSSDAIKILSKLAKAYAVLHNTQENIEQDYIKLFVKKYCPQKHNLLDKNQLLSDLKKCFPIGQYGDRIGIQNFEINRNFRGEIAYEGNIYISLTGHFGDEFSQIAFYTYNKIISSNQVLEFWPEYEKSDNVKIQYRFTKIVEGSTDHVVDIKVYDEDDLQEMIYVETDVNSYISIDILAKGTGNLKLGIIHHRFSRKNYGAMVLGGERLIDSKTRQEILTYFEPGNLKPPLNIYFSGYRSAEGFEGYGMIKALGRPFMLVTDPRLEGGAFYFGSDELEEKLVEKIKYNLDYLGFDNSQVVTSGLSMGTCGALYYGAKIEANSILVGLPLASIGNIAYNQKIIAPGVFSTSLDILKFHTGSLLKENVEILNNRFWRTFNKANFNNSKIICSYMRDDDYDRTAYYDIINSLKGKNTLVLSKGLPGRHSDATASIIAWFYDQYKEVMKKDFSIDGN